MANLGHEGAVAIAVGIVSLWLTDVIWRAWTRHRKRRKR